MAQLRVEMLFEFQVHIENVMSDLFLGPGLNWTSPLGGIKILYSHVAVDKLTVIVRKDNTRKFSLL